MLLYTEIKVFSISLAFSFLKNYKSENCQTVTAMKNTLLASEIYAVINLQNCYAFEVELSYKRAAVSKNSKLKKYSLEERLWNGSKWKTKNITSSIKSNFLSQPTMYMFRND